LQNIREGIEGVPAKWYNPDIFNLIFPDVDKTQANNLWKDQLSKKQKKRESKKEKEEDSEDDD
jgi:Lon-like ATP-dependent protease